MHLLKKKRVFNGTVKYFTVGIVIACITTNEILVSCLRFHSLLHFKALENALHIAHSHKDEALKI